MENFLTKDEIRRLVDDYMNKSDKIVMAQEILDSGRFPELKGFMVRSGKVSDCVFGGPGEFTVDRKKYEKAIPAAPHDVKYFTKIVNRKETELAHVEFENPPFVGYDSFPLIIMNRTMRASTHDIVRGEIPFKDQILAANHNFMRKLVASAIGTSQLDVEGLSDNSNVIVAEYLTQIPFENVIRSYMAVTNTSTSLYVHFMKGERKFCGHDLPDNLIPNGKLPYVMDTPSTKSDEHDESVSPETLFERGLCTRQQYNNIKKGSLLAYDTATQYLAAKGIILVDTKLEHGKDRNGRIKSQDEILTMDSSRFWLTEDYNKQLAQLARGEIKELKPTSYSKQFARDMSEGENGYTDDQRAQIAVRYIEGIQLLLGRRFEPDLRTNEERTVTGIEKVLNQYVRKAV